MRQRELRDPSNSQVLDCQPTERADVVVPETGGFVDASGNVVAKSKLPSFLIRSITHSEADEKLRTLSLAVRASVLAKATRAKSFDKRALFDRKTRMPVFTVDQGAMHWMRPTSGNIWPNELIRIRNAIGGDRGAFCLIMLIELATQLTTPEMYIVCDGISVQTMKPWTSDAHVQILVQRAPGLTKWLNSDQLNDLAGTHRDQTRSDRITKLHQGGAILVEERRRVERAGEVRFEHRFLLNPLLFKGNSAVIEAVHVAAVERWRDPINIADQLDDRVIIADNYSMGDAKIRGAI